MAVVIRLDIIIRGDRMLGSEFKTKVDSIKEGLYDELIKATNELIDKRKGTTFIEKKDMADFALALQSKLLGRRVKPEFINPLYDLLIDENLSLELDEFAYPAFFFIANDASNMTLVKDDNGISIGFQHI